ncbi:hypothetical protein B296_00028460 [Ensete ventricosum]|uniref:Uncharacterized protein n=1 Tax=Ensete ventricosum TaxID=4639 RepID=A0A426XTM6_ENSVE|nr:hypothetical protein B296_00028460 [Ensete ventricosum]
MTIKQKSPTFGSFIHQRLGEIRGGRQSITSSKNNFLYHLWQRFILSHQHQSIKGHVSNKIGTYRKHILSKKIYICLYETI